MNPLTLCTGKVQLEPMLSTSCHLPGGPGAPPVTWHGPAVVREAELIIAFLLSLFQTFPFVSELCGGPQECE